MAPSAIPSASSARNASPLVAGRQRGRDDRGRFRRADAVPAGQHAHSLAADQLLEATGSAAIDPGVVDAGHRQVADLTGAAVRAGAHRSVQHDAQPDAAVQPEQRIVGAVAGRAEQTLGDRGQVDVVALADRDAEGLGHQRWSGPGSPSP